MSRQHGQHRHISVTPREGGIDAPPKHSGRISVRPGPPGSPRRARSNDGFFISEGMLVTDRYGEVVGTVGLVYAGGASDAAIERALSIADAVAANGGGQVGESSRAPSVTFASDDVPPEVRVRMLRRGYFRIDGPGITGVRRYVTPDQIAGVTGNRVRLYASRAELLRDPQRSAECARFFERTNLNSLRPDIHIDFTLPGGYDLLLEHISTHRWYMGIEQERPVSWEEAVLDWYDNLYAPVIRIIEERQILDKFPWRTASDLYLWIMDHRYYASLKLGRDVGVEAAVRSFAMAPVSLPRQALRWARHRLGDATQTRLWAFLSNRGSSLLKKVGRRPSPTSRSGTRRSG
jgi:hypothetical protein